MRTIEEIDDVQAKRETVIRVEGNDVIADCLNRRIGDKDSGVKLDRLSLLFAYAKDVPDYILQAAIKMTLIRVQDDARRTMQVDEIKALDGTVIDAHRFWEERQGRKARAVKPISFEKASEAVGKASKEQQAALLKSLLAANPELASLLK
jgi:hypothetical protein